MPTCGRPGREQECMGISRLIIPTSGTVRTRARLEGKLLGLLLEQGERLKPCGLESVVNIIAVRGLLPGVGEGQVLHFLTWPRLPAAFQRCSCFCRTLCRSLGVLLRSHCLFSRLGVRVWFKAALFSSTEVGCILQLLLESAAGL